MTEVCVDIAILTTAALAKANRKVKKYNDLHIEAEELSSKEVKQLNSNDITSRFFNYGLLSKKALYGRHFIYHLKLDKQYHLVRLIKSTDDILNDKKMVIGDL